MMYTGSWVHVASEPGLCSARRKRINIRPHFDPGRRQRAAAQPLVAYYPNARVPNGTAQDPYPYVPGRATAAMDYSGIDTICVYGSRNSGPAVRNRDKV